MTRLNAGPTGSFGFRESSLAVEGATSRARRFLFHLFLDRKDRLKLIHEDPSLIKRKPPTPLSKTAQPPRQNGPAKNRHWQLRSARWQLASLTPGYNLPLLRSWTNSGSKTATKLLRNSTGSAIPLGRLDSPQCCTQLQL